MTNRKINAPHNSDSRTVRASVSLPENHYSELERIACHKKVSLAWVVREAVETYLAEQWPLLENASLIEAKQEKLKK